MNELKPLIIGDLEIRIPIIQGGMGVMVSTSSLAAAVADLGAAGVIAGVGLGYGTKENRTNFPKASREGLRKEIKRARELTSGVIGVNLLTAISNYKDLVTICTEEKADFIVSGAGLPLRLPEYTFGCPIKLVPIVSSARAADIIIKSWKKRYNRLPDAFVVEGPHAGGHLGFNSKALSASGPNDLQIIVKNVLDLIREKEINIPIIAAGGIFDGKDIANFLKLGAQGVQMASRFVVTNECSISEKFKDLYITATKDDILIIESPVGMPGRVIKTDFIDKIKQGRTTPIRCNWRCLKACDPNTTPYCICEALYNAIRGNLEKAVVFAGNNVWRIKEKTTVKNLIDELVNEATAELNK